MDISRKSILELRNLPAGWKFFLNSQPKPIAMPVNKDALSRYRWIDERLRNKRQPSPTLKDLIRFVSEKLGKEISVRTLQKDLEDMRHDGSLNYQAPIIFDRRNMVYRYEDPDFTINKIPISEYDLQGLEIAIGILEQFKNLPVIRQFEDAILKIASTLKINRELLENNGMIKMDIPGQFKGQEWIADLVEMIKFRNEIRISYQSFERKEPKEYLVEPYHLREYQNRFYLVGGSYRNGETRILTFGLDRILEIWPTKQKFEIKNFDQDFFFRNVVGISAPEGSPQNILLSFSSQQSKYILSQPIHHSQKLIRQNSRECLVSLDLIVNIELIMVLMSFGSQVKVINPESLAERIREEATRVVHFYKKSKKIKD